MRHMCAVHFYEKLGTEPEERHPWRLSSLYDELRREQIEASEDLARRIGVPPWRVAAGLLCVRPGLHCGVDFRVAGLPIGWTSVSGPSQQLTTAPSHSDRPLDTIGVGFGGWTPPGGCVGF